MANYTGVVKWFDNDRGYDLYLQMMEMMFLYTIQT